MRSPRTATRSSSGRRRWRSTGRGRRARDRDERDVQDPAVEPDACFWPEAERRAVPHVGGRVRLRADGPAARVLVRPVPRQAAREERADAAGTRTRATGAATSTTGHHVLDAVPRRRRARTAACTSSTAATATACSSTASPTTCRATCCSASPTSHAPVACPIARRRRHVPPQQDAAHDDRERHRPRGARILTQHLRAVGGPKARATTTRGRSTSTSSPANARSPRPADPSCFSWRLWGSATRSRQENQPQVEMASDMPSIGCGVSQGRRSMSARAASRSRRGHRLRLAAVHVRGRAVVVDPLGDAPREQRRRRRRGASPRRPRGSSRS